MKTNNKGVGAVIILLSILVVTAIGFTGYYVWNSQQNSKENSDGSPNSVNSNENSTTTLQAQSEEPQDNQKYLVIKEWDVKMPLTEYLSDAVYSDRLGEFIETDTAYLSKKSYVDAFSGCEGAGGAIVRFSGPDDDFFKDGPPITSFENAKKDAIKINDYYYIRISPQSMCGDPNDEDTWAKNSEQMSREFQKAYEGLVAN
jgi:hypothetical protein